MFTRESFHKPLEFELSATHSHVFGGTIRRAQGVDIGPQGIGLLTNYPLTRCLVLRLVMPANGVAASVPVFAEVAWSGPSGQSGNHVRAGLRFLM